MDEDVAASPAVRDADGNALMSLEELKEGMFQSIRDNGTVELIRAQLRRRFIEKLQQQRRLRDDQDDENNASRANRSTPSSTPDEKLVHGLVAEYLASKCLENTLAVFVPEIGGSRNQVDSATILEMLHVSSTIQNQLELERANTGHSLLLVLVRELVRRFQLATMDSGTQTAMDCFDHRVVLENQLRRVENTYLAECAAQKLEPQKSLEERMVQYQREYDDICDKRLQEELERYKSTEVALVRAEERKRFDREVDNVRASLLQEYHDKQERLQERERELELAFVARRTELETSLFETRQSLFKDMERLRVKEAELQVKVESDFRHFASETQRFQLWEESVRTQEANLESIVAQAMREKERSWQIERQKALQDIQTKQDELSEREQALTSEIGTLKTLKAQVVALQQEVAALEAALSKSGDDLRSAQHSAVQLEKDSQRLQERVEDLELQTGEQKSNLNDANTAHARLAADRILIDDELARYRQKNTELKEELKLVSAEVKSLQQQILDMKFDEANAIVAERKRFMQMMDDERDRFQWKENELLAKVRELQCRLAESEALAEKYQSQYEDEKFHVESLRHDVSSLNSLLTQAQATINAKHGAPRENSSLRTQRVVGCADMFDTGSPDRSGSERTFMMKMMEMMANIQDAGSSRQEPVQQSQPRNEDQEETKRLKQEQDRIERELLEQREYEKKKQARMDEQERELAEQHRLFEEKMARMRQERIEEEERLEDQRKRKQAEEETRLHEELARQRAAVQDAAELRQKLEEQRLVDERKRLQDAQAYQERRLVEEQKFNEEIEAKRRQQQREDEAAARQREEQKEEEERVRRANEEQERILLEKEREAAKLKQEEEDRQRDITLQLVEEEIKRKESEDAVQADEDAGSSWQESSVGDDTSPNISEEAKPGLVLDGIADIDNGTTGVVSNDQDSIPTENAPSDEDQLQEVELVRIASTSDTEQDDNDSISSIPVAATEPPTKTPEEEEQERHRAAEEAKQKEDENVIDVYRQRVLARKAAEKQRQMEQEAENARKAKEEEERQRLQLLGDGSESDHELELSGGSFAESSAASNSDSF
ncbi:hypothetical protein PF005_g2106 [Phytophthora fragariae]|uniref:Uncharacterized protein n=1 Tax=Phytophthora fragariae TaxID=53985 RepID=A0A6A3LF96_9STRA|nr:hypothetical protein PF009_g2257 [Phytophthora fragariae]KAE9017250.1 hypothetical protein PF011_g6778 [Phytophthora fragariae]KAE9124668.1 hypothetical protein PF010_g5916 [Phytophthora fragariae]KAE9136680.1 hypothetical protein PF007_g2098 [Phytophthora fragariae]KAE9149765.1 hypothetical protein PF006_g5796 [Phytophthora fragariae]